jgi:hypothetical protein
MSEQTASSIQVAILANMVRSAALGAKAATLRLALQQGDLAIAGADLEIASCLYGAASDPSREAQTKVTQIAKRVNALVDLSVDADSKVRLAVNALYTATHK